MTSTRPRQTRSPDRTRQIVVTIAEVFCVLGTLVGTGVIGTRVQETAGGALSADATRLAPAGTAFSIWTVIYLGLAAYTLYQWLPEQTSRAIHRQIGYWVAASMALNATWLLVTQQNWLWTSVGVIVALAVVLGIIAQRLAGNTTSSRTDQVIVHGTFGLYLGWVAVATGANVTATLVAKGVDPPGWIATPIALVILAVVAALGTVFAWRLAKWSRIGLFSVAGAMAWGLLWIAVGRLADEPFSFLTGIGALAAAAVVLWFTWRTTRRG